MLDALTRHDWPGNVRALRHAAERAVIMADGDHYRPDDFPLPQRSEAASISMVGETPQPRPARKADDRAGAADAPFQRFARCIRTGPEPRRALPAHGEAWTLGASSSSGSPGARSFSSARSCSSPRRRPRPASAPASSSLRSSGSVALGSLWNFIRRTNFLVSRFIESVRFEDYSQRFSDPSGGGFDVLGQTLDQALKTLQARHTQESAEARYLAAIVDDSPSALLTVDRDGHVEILNKAARQLFARVHLNRLEDLEALGPELGAAVKLASGHPQDHPAHPRRRPAEGDLRFGPSRAARPAGDGVVDPPGAERAGRPRSRGAGRPRARPHPRDHEFAYARDVTRTDRRRAGRDRRQARQCAGRREDGDRNGRPPR